MSRVDLWTGIAYYNKQKKVAMEKNHSVLKHQATTRTLRTDRDGAIQKSHT